MNLVERIKAEAEALPQKPGKSRYIPHADAIKELRSKGFTLREICQFLSDRNVPAKVSSLGEFIQKWDSKAKPMEEKSSSSSPDILARLNM